MIDTQFGEFETVPTTFTDAYGCQWAEGEFEESEHPRDEGGQFALKNAPAAKPKPAEFETMGGGKQASFISRGGKHKDKPGQKTLFEVDGLRDEGEPETLESKISAFLAKNPKASISDIGRAVGVKPGTGRDPMKSELNKALVAMRSAGKLTATEPRFGEPSFSVAAKPDSSMKESFPLGGGFGAKGKSPKVRDRAIESSVTQAVKEVAAIKKREASEAAQEIEDEKAAKLEKLRANPQTREEITSNAEKLARSLELDKKETRAMTRRMIKKADEFGYLKESSHAPGQLFAEDDAPRWITIGGKAEGDKKHKGGFPVQIDGDGTILKGGPKGMQGRHVSEIGSFFDEKRREKEADEPPKRTQEEQAAHEANAPGNTRSFAKIVEFQADNWGIKAEEYSDLANELFVPFSNRDLAREEAKLDARQQLGITAGDVRRLENQGFDSGSVHKKIRRLDTVGRALATEHPDLGWGGGFENEGADDTPYDELVWDLIREGKQKPPSRTSPAFHDFVDDYLEQEFKRFGNATSAELAAAARTVEEDDFDFAEGDDR